MRRLATLALAAVTGCAYPPKPLEVKVPVTVPCLGAVPQRPAVTFGAGAYPGDKVAAQAALVDSLAFQEYSTRLEVAQTGCLPSGKQASR